MFLGFAHCSSSHSQNEKCRSLLVQSRWRERGRASASLLAPVAKGLGANMHPGMGVSAGDRRYGENTVMQSRNGVCDKIENYISDLGQWYVSKSWLIGKGTSDWKSNVEPPLNRLLASFKPERGRGTPEIKVAGV